MKKVVDRSTLEYSNDEGSETASEEKRKYEEISKTTELQDDVSAEASKLKIQEMVEVSRQIMEEMKAEQQKRVGELAQGSLESVQGKFQMDNWCLYVHNSV